MIDFNITDEELNALKIYKEKNYEAINQMLISNSETDIALLSAEVENKVVSIEYDRESVIEYLRTIKLIYRLILKIYYKKSPKLNKKIYRGTNLSEIERFKNELFIDRFLVATENEDDAINNHSSNWNRPACMNITLDSDIPYVFIKDVLKDKKYKNEVLISPFTKVKFIKEENEKRLEKNSKIIKIYDVELEKQELDELTDRERNGLYNYILENSYSIKRKLEECINLEKENVINFENIRKLEQLLSKYENDIEEKETSDEYSDLNREEDLDDIARISKELEELKETSAELFGIRKEYIDFINIWKRNIAVYMIAECKEIEKQFEDCNTENMQESEKEKSNDGSEEDNLEKENKDEVKDLSEEEKLSNDCDEDDLENEVKDEIEDLSKKEKINEDSEKSDLEKEDLEKPENVVKLMSEKEMNNLDDKIKKYTEKNITDKIEESKDKEESQVTKVLKTYTDNINLNKSEFSEETPMILNAKNECKENIESAEKLLVDIRDLISKQQNHAKIAGNIGASYSALNNAFEMRKVAETLLELLKNIELKVNVISKLEDEKEATEKLETISKKNIEISTLINYLNNPKIAARNSKATRFDEMAIIEENELKRGIAERIRDIRGEAELKKLKDDLEIIEDKGTLSRFFGFFTGQNKLDECMIEQIEIRQIAIRRTLARKLSLAYNYSVHELMAEIEMFINENEDDELVENDVIDLRALAEELKRNFVVLDSKVQSIIEEKEGKNLPLENRKVSKTEIIEIETYRFLRKYGYDIQKDEKEEPKYQDTMANEIARIVEYINSSKIL